MTASAKPFVKWVGGKSQILHEIRSRYPTGLGSSVTKYAEPFVGGGAVLFNILNNYDLENVYISDINRELILAYTAIRDKPCELIRNLTALEEEYLTVAEAVRKEMYYVKRERFNTLKSKKSGGLELAALFIFLNKTCFNGLYRVNAKGLFNVPQGSYKKPKICDKDNIRAVSEKLQNVIIVCADYRKSADFIDRNTFAYFDPPYRPLTETASFTSYSQDGFDDEQQTELARFIDEMSERGAYMAVSNSDPKNTDEKDEFFDLLYAKHTVTRVSAMRVINSVGTKRGNVNELLICN